MGGWKLQMEKWKIENGSRSGSAVAKTIADGR
jgi:hypothetical protein